MKTVIEFTVMFMVQISLYTLLIFNCRAVAQANILWSVVSDFLYASASYLVLRKIAKSGDSMALFFGYTLGSAAGAVTGILLSKFFLKA
jgi:hypothetical protein